MGAMRLFLRTVLLQTDMSRTLWCFRAKVGLWCSNFTEVWYRSYWNGIVKVANLEEDQVMIAH